ncbi:MAG: domain fusion protein YloV [Actinomycetia bacterium]|nr:domain fusion protein YloV [Actinomycetes bacterium]
MPTLSRLAAPDLRRAVLRFRDALRAHQEELNRLNVYPVPDGDTGTNMALTLESVSAELDTAESMEEVCHAISRGSLMGARGNSGVILSQILRGFADEFSPLEAIDAAALASGLRRASDAAYQAVMRPVEGTILTVVRAAAEASERHEGDGLVTLLEHASNAACDAVERTPDLLPVLKDAGVVDAGGKGFTLLLDALLEIVDGRPIPEPEVVTTPRIVEAHLRGDDVAGLRYEVMYLLEAEDDTIPAFKQAWDAVGDSIVVVGGEGLWNCHIHTNDIGASVEAGIEAGRPRSVRVTDLFEQVEEEQWVRDGGVGGASAATAGRTLESAVVAVAVGDGVRRLLTSLGVQQVVAGGQSMNPSTAQILEAVEACTSEAVIVLPNNKNIVPVARQVDSLTDRKVVVVPTTSVTEALAALVGYDPDADIDRNVEAMTESMSRVRSGEVTQAVRDSAADGSRITEGDWIALSRDGIRASASSAVDAMKALLSDLVDDDSEIVTVLIGQDAKANDTARIKEHLEFAYPHVEVEFHDGGQPLYPYLLGVE